MFIKMLKLRIADWLKHLFLGIVFKILGKEKGIDRLLTSHFKIREISKPIIAKLIIDECDEFAPETENIINNRLFARKWNAMKAAQFLVKCKPEVAVVILNQWNQDPKFKDHAIKAQIVLGILLSAPPFVPELDKKIIPILDFMAITNRPMIENILKGSPLDAVMAYLGRTKFPGLNPILGALPIETAVPIFFMLKMNFPDTFNGRIGKLPPALSGQIRAKIREVEEQTVRIQEYGVKIKNFEKSDTLLGKLIPPPPPAKP